MKNYLELESWPRREHFEFFRKFDEPFFGATVTVDCTRAYTVSKERRYSYFLYYLHKTLVAANAVPAFKYRISGEKVIIHEVIHGSATIGREDGSFGFSLIEFDPDFDHFAKKALVEIERVKKASGLFTRSFDEDNLIHFSALPWVNFTSLSHARNYALADSCPKISFGKMLSDAAGDKSMSMSVHVHHALMDGLHVGEFIDCFQQQMNL
ncbi:MAG: chloramphenicol acetyltransferase [Flavobacterium sp. BFFFF1]|uniref:chloramphenicol acetyltransferase n=1 Tax=Flavobacterium sp. BFFFF1 TaxID=2015557 RepID=UPI000BD9E044|nr:chloramphenicol acetyltransferase [Flavobacterium sp. BFFFF1]OYU81398.1 MAG: chloramphenicol acetyltransferase [Flavobacterium sp. BFFFF1]